MAKSKHRENAMPQLFEEDREERLFPTIADAEKPQLCYENINGKLFYGDSIEWLKTLPTGSVDLVFADPPYNINKADWDTFESQEAYIEWSLLWIVEASRVLNFSFR
jgi:site-specific DNA-methyltransferase (adenine-specific)